MSRSRVALLVFLVVVAIQASYAFYRTAEVVREQIDSPFSKLPDGICDARTDLSMLVWQKRRGVDSDGSICPEPLNPNVDNDGDGLTGVEESLQFTSDKFFDSDGDGINDREDRCPNCFVNNYRGRIESHVISGIVRDWAKEGTVYLVAESGSFLEVDSPTGKSVVVDEIGFYYLYIHTDALPDVRCGENGYVRAFTRVFIPGVFYVYEVDQWFGGVCGCGDLVFVIDLPFVGPVTIGKKTTWVS